MLRLIGRVTHIRENGAASGVGVLANFAYDDLGRRTALTRGNGTITDYSYDAAGRLDELVQNLAGSANDNTDTFSDNPAGQIVSRTRSNTGYSFASHINVDTLFGHDFS
ncbi:MAG: RHS repeat domain-containing protein [Oceanicaulis sp.]